MSSGRITVQFHGQVEDGHLVAVRIATPLPVEGAREEAAPPKANYALAALRRAIALARVRTGGRR